MMSSSTGPPVFTPSWSSFKDFNSFIKEVEEPLSQWGMIRVIPPREWMARENYDMDKINFTIKTPITQHIVGEKGVYEMLLCESKRIQLKQFQKLSQSKEFSANFDIKDPELVEYKFWKNIRFSPPLYGADSAGTLFDDKVCTSWNLNHLNSILDKVAVTVPGVNTPMLYVGMWRSTFSWHTEDMDLYSINYLHFGAPKYWYCIPPSDREKFEAMAISYFPEQYKKCNQFLRHKNTLISPSVIKQHNVTIHKMVHEPGQFVITAPGAYHAGFNSGFNCAESVNFATEKWIEVGMKADYCDCRADTVRLSMSAWADLQNVAEGGEGATTPGKTSDTKPTGDTPPKAIHYRRMMFLPSKTKEETEADEQDEEIEPGNEMQPPEEENGDEEEPSPETTTPTKKRTSTRSKKHKLEEADEYDEDELEEEDLGDYIFGDDGDDDDFAMEDDGDPAYKEPARRRTTPKKGQSPKKGSPKKGSPKKGGSPSKKRNQQRPQQQKSNRHPLFATRYKSLYKK